MIRKTLNERSTAREGSKLAVLEEEVSKILQNKEAFLAKLKVAILNRNAEELLKYLLLGRFTVPFDLLEMGFNYSRFVKNTGSPPHSEFQVFSAGHSHWVYAMQYADDKNAAIAFLLDYLRTIPLSHGDCLLALWALDEKSAISFLDSIAIADPQFECLGVPKNNWVQFNPRLSPLISPGINVFEAMQLLYKHNTHQPIIIAPECLLARPQLENIFPDPPKQNIPNQENNQALVRNKRNHYIALQYFLLQHDIFSESEINQVFVNFWAHHFNFPVKVYPFKDRSLQMFQTCSPKSLDFQVFLELLPRCPAQLRDKVKALFDAISFWVDEFQVVTDQVYAWNPSYVVEQWKALIIYDLTPEDPNPRAKDQKYRSDTGLNSVKRPTRPTSEEIIDGLRLIAPAIDKEFLIGVINHPAEEVRKYVQLLFKAKDSDLREIHGLIQQIDNQFDEWMANEHSKAGKR